MRPAARRVNSVAASRQSKRASVNTRRTHTLSSATTTRRRDGQHCTASNCPCTRLSRLDCQGSTTAGQEVSRLLRVRAGDGLTSVNPAAAAPDLAPDSSALCTSGRVKELHLSDMSNVRKTTLGNVGGRRELSSVNELTVGREVSHGENNVRT